MNAPQTPDALQAPHTNAAWHARRLAATPRGVGVFGDFYIDKAKNAEFWDIEGRRFIDFAGGIVVHTTAGVSALVIALMLGKRIGFPRTLMLPHSPALTVAGAGMLWVGWFGLRHVAELGSPEGMTA